MASESLKLPLVVIVGPTASGKTSLAVKLAKKFKGEIISADSRAIYRDLNVGTAKPSAEEQEGVPHWGIDLVLPGEYYSVADFKEYTLEKINEIRARGHIPFLVGGTGLYVDAVIFDYQFKYGPDTILRQNLQQNSVQELVEICNNQNITLPNNDKNKRYLIRAIENKGVNTNRLKAPIDNSIIVGIATEKSYLVERITKRTEQLFDDDVVNEAKVAGAKYGWGNEAMKSNIYPLIRQYLDGGLSLEETKIKFNTLDWRLAKRQLTWLRRNKFIHWLPVSDAFDYISNQLAIDKQS
jgi:tRNA dimethylallyltransferase